MSTLSSGKPHAPPKSDIWLPSEGRYLSRIKLITLRDYLHALFNDGMSAPVDQRRATDVLRKMWREIGAGREPGNSHAYRHLLTLRLLGLVAPHGKRDGYALAPRGAKLLQMGERGKELNRGERDLLSDAMFSPPGDMASPLLAFLGLFAAGASSALQFRDIGSPVVLRRYTPASLEVTATQGCFHITDKDAVDHVVWGCRSLLLEVGLIGELPPGSAVPLWQRTLFPVEERRDQELDAAVDGVLSYIREALNRKTRLPIPEIGADLRPKMKLSHATFQAILTRIARDHAGEIYLDRLSSILIAGREDAYVRIGDYWRSSIIRC